MTQIDGLLIGAIAGLVTAVSVLYFAGRKDAKTHAERLEKLAKDFAEQIASNDKKHKEQEDDLHARHEKQLTEMVGDHRKEMSGMVDRTIEAYQNDKTHDRDERARIMALAESLERRTQSGRGGGR